MTNFITLTVHLYLFTFFDMKCEIIGIFVQTSTNCFAKQAPQLFLAQVFHEQAGQALIFNEVDFWQKFGFGDISSALQERQCRIFNDLYCVGTRSIYGGLQASSRFVRPIRTWQGPDEREKRHCPHRSKLFHTPPSPRG